MANTPIQNRPTTHPNNGGQAQPVDVKTQQFSTTGGVYKKPTAPKRGDFSNTLDFANALADYIEQNKKYQESLKQNVLPTDEIQGVGESELDSFFGKYADLEPEFFDQDVEGATNHFIDSLSKDDVEEMISYGLRNSTQMNGDPSYAICGWNISIVAMMIQKKIYGNTKGKAITQQEFDELEKKDYSQPNSYYLNTMLDEADFKAQKNVVFYRGLRGINSNQVKRVREGYYSNGANYSKALIGSQRSYSGSAIYTASEKRYAEENDYDRSLLITGCVDTKNGTIKTLTFSMQKSRELRDKILNSHCFDNLNARLKKLGYDDTTSEQLAKNFKYSLTEANTYYGSLDFGMAAMLMGYDVVFNEDRQIDILNPNIMKIVAEE